MTQLIVNAAEQGIVNLDEYGDSVNLKNILIKNCPDKVQKIVLNLERCWIEYAHAYLFIDESLRLLQKSTYTGRKSLFIKTSINLGTPQFMATFVFRLSQVIGCQGNDTPGTVLERIQNFGVKENLEISIEATPFPDKPLDIRNQVYLIGSPI